jgi:hypothetical protein
MQGSPALRVIEVPAGERQAYAGLLFRRWRIERDRFDAARGYAPDLCEDGIPVRDMIWLERVLE